MPGRNRPSSFAWFIVHVTFSLVPFFLEGVIRIIVLSDISLDDIQEFNPGDVCWNTWRCLLEYLAMSVGILCLFVNQSLMGYKRIIYSKDDNR
uniref:Uncharacterized protein n=1 Tax=Candidatus Kentrum sp. TUN TaxID=2126343 RepID=A0A450ZRB1_9GAMM|nr:MAG: hypothetical protein BECKTUN1418D_GA0071000_10449 [Candidatus Kentron sp. TUN]